ncbi:MAG TPA: hypothetical protein VHB25_21320 [Gemmatimonadaceae bacterium]|nr:hypothetical protein [Gemmatimonadaceae bacterium]
MTRASIRTAMLAACSIAVIIVVIALFQDLRQLALVFLVAYAAAVSVVLGTLAMTLIAHLTTATWFRPFRAPAEQVIRTLPVLAGLGVLLLVAMPTLYPWAGTRDPARVYLNGPFFVVRWIVYWIAWLAIARGLHTARRIERQGEVARAARRYRVVSCVGLVALAFTMTFAAIDWMMSLTPDWASTIYGVIWFAGGLVGALALLAVLASGSDATPAVPTADEHSLGKLLVTFVLFWLYVSFAQYVVIWSGDVPEEVTWYAARTHGGWGVVAGVLVLFGFALPFVLLLLAPVKRSRRALAALGLLLLAMHYVDTFWMLAPGVVPVDWWTVIAGCAVLVLVVAALAWRFSRLPAAAPV